MDFPEDTHRPNGEAKSQLVRLIAGPPIPVNEDIRGYFYVDDEASTENEPWTLKPEIPSPEEVLGTDIPDDGDDSIQLLPNMVTGPWPSKDDYLRAHYELLREDAVSPLRDAVAYIQDDPQMHDSSSVSIYEKVHIIGVTYAQKGLAFRVQFSTRRAGKNIVWDYSKRLISGSIVALSPARDCFRSKCIVAIVAARPVEGVKKHPPEVDLYFARPEDAEFDPHKEWVMVESRCGYYEASRHTMAALQKMTKERFPLEDHICSLNPEVEAPQYIKQNPVLDIQSAIESEEGKMVNVLRDWPAGPMGSLDATQWAALEEILTKQLAIVQGPPGTGKTFVSVAALKVLLANRLGNDPPIIIAAQTNHALDQLLAHVSHFEKNFIRLGGRSNEPEIKRRSVYAVRGNEPATPIKGGLLGPSRKSFQGLAFTIAELIQAFNQDTGSTVLPSEFFAKQEVLTEGQCKSLEAGAKGWIQSDSEEDVDPMAIWLGDQKVKFEVKYMAENFGFSEDEIDLEYEQLKELEAEQGIGDDDYETLKGQYSHIQEDFYGEETGFTTSKSAVQEYMKYQDLWKIPLKARGAVYNALRNASKENIVAGIRKLMVLYNLNCENLTIGKWERDYFVLKDANVIGMTTTGLSKYRGLVSSLKPKVILIEEAAESIEAPISAACFDSLQHLILVGDHKQLKGTCAVQDLTGPPFFLDMSMFERLVHNGMKYTTLRRQRRMAPEMRQLLEPIYGKLHDHPAVLERPGIPGMGDVKSYWFTHNWPENSDSLASKINEMEAQMISEFYAYLVMNGTPAEDITVLTFYNGQRKRLLKLLKQHPYLQGMYVKVVTVDSYQGEENEVVILSLVRSGNSRNVGFLSVENRTCVALSRAKCGFYIFGNAKILAIADPLWWTVISTMGGEMPDERRLGFHLPLTCTRHGRKNFVTEPDGFDKINGGCNWKCNLKLKCGHKCPILCHSFSHDRVNCNKTCRTRHPCGHSCTQTCSDGHICGCNCKSAKTKVSPKKKAFEAFETEQILLDITEDTRDDAEKHRQMVNGYHAFANGGAKEHDEILLAKAKSQAVEEGTNVAVVAEGIGDLLLD